MLGFALGRPFPERVTHDAALLIVRIGFGLSVAFAHGAPKLTAWLAGDGSFPDPIGIGAANSLLLAGLAEVIGGACVVLGLATRVATLPLLGVLAVATWVVNGCNGFLAQEKPLVFLMALLAVHVGGPGRLSMDYHIVSRRR